MKKTVNILEYIVGINAIIDCQLCVFVKCRMGNMFLIISVCYQGKTFIHNPFLLTGLENTADSQIGKTHLAIISRNVANGSLR